MLRLFNLCPISGPWVLVVCTAWLAGAAGCAHNKPPETTSAAPPVTARQEAAATPAQTPQAAPATPTQRTCANDLECEDRQLCIRSRCVAITPDLAECSTVRVHFEYDSADLHGDDNGSMQRVARCLKADRAMHITVEGNADERGTEDYNLALGDKRASAVERYLESLGVSAAQLKTVSYGKENPLCSEHNEQCWAQNRRAALKTQMSASPVPTQKAGKKARGK